MKKILLLATIGLFSVGVNAQQGSPNTSANLPAKSKTVLKNYFNPSSVSSVKVDGAGMKKEYEVILTNGTKVEFDKDGNWKEVKSPTGDVPAKLLPNSVVNYVKKNHPNSKIKKVEKDRRKYDVELLDGTDLEFDLQGRFLRYDN